ncbi:f420-dependent NADP reductase [Grosmannia clavigera kw1407]|uniref:F420-dependent NADP reductase n=1 Tax=Grosmannia clavigera (strain kw1407 / UAMH 11150) TaxID=655863 RepID=F0X7A6_GROCL|nr:f420-dependent NADP reductase [Grosmannia clavigera kw1407]EFX06364.1 f420-dependent NADP reductase [Grosmannia clavigera kw1407]
MKIAIAGAGDVAKYLTEELLLVGHEVVVISRRKPEWFKRDDVDFRIVEYAVTALTKAIDDCDGLVSTILDYSMRFADAHVELVEACKKSRKCKRFIPSEYAGNTDEFPDEPWFYFANHKPHRKLLREQTEIKWTLFNMGWLTDYMIPKRLRYIKDIGEKHPINLDDKTVIIPGTGEELVAFTSIRDSCRAIVRLFDFDQWDPIIYVCGETTTWNKIAATMAERVPGITVSHRSQEELQKKIDAAESEDKVIAAQYDMWSISGAGLLPEGKLTSQKKKYFDGLQFRTIGEFLSDADKSDGKIAV